MLLMPFGQRSLALTKGLICAFAAEQPKGASSPINRYILKLEAELGAPITRVHQSHRPSELPHLEQPVYEYA